SELTVSKLNSSISGPSDLPKIKVGCVQGTSVAGNYLNRRGISFTPYEDPTKLLEGLVRGEVDAVVGGAPQLRYRATTEQPGRITVLPGTFLNQGVGFALRKGNPLRKQINVALLTIIEGDEWPKLMVKYLG